MKLPNFDYYRPQTLDEICSFLLEFKKDGKILSGGTALIPYLKHRWIVPKAVISLSGIPYLQYMEYDEEKGLSIGACTTLDVLSKSLLIIKRYPAVGQAAEEIGVPGVRFMGTLGGNLCQDTRCIYFNQSHFWRKAHEPCFKRGGNFCYAHVPAKRCHAVYQSDMASILMALGAKVRLVSTSGERLIYLSDFFTGNGKSPNTLAFDEVMVEIQLPPLQKNCVSAYEKLRIREAIDFPLAGVAVVIETSDDKNTVNSIRVIAGGVSPAPMELKRTEDTIRERTIDDELMEEAAAQAYLEVEPGKTIVDNLCMPLDYRRKMIKVLLKQAVRKALT